jgi:hypothetical protein
MCQLRILVFPAIHLSAVHRLVLALSQFADSFGTSISERVRIDSVGLDFSNRVRNGAIRLALNLRSVPEWDETVVLKFPHAKLTSYQMSVSLKNNVFQPMEGF